MAAAFLSLAGASLQIFLCASLRARVALAFPARATHAKAMRVALSVAPRLFFGVVGRIGKWRVLPLSFFFVGLFFFPAAHSLHGQTQKPPIEIDIPILAAGFGGAFFDETAHEFEKLRPDVRVHITGDARIQEKIRIRVMAGELPDATDAELLYDTLIATGKIRDIGPASRGTELGETTRVGRDIFLPGVLIVGHARAGKSTASPLPTASGRFSTIKAISLPNMAGHRRAPGTSFLRSVLRCGPPASLRCPFPEFICAMVTPFSALRYYNLAGPEGFRAYNELRSRRAQRSSFIRAAEIVQRSRPSFMEPAGKG